MPAMPIETKPLFDGPEGFEDSSSASIERAVGRILRLLYKGIELPRQPLTDLIPTAERRNREISGR